MQNGYLNLHDLPSHLTAHCRLASLTRISLCSVAPHASNSLRARGHYQHSQEPSPVSLFHREICSALRISCPGLGYWLAMIFDCQMRGTSSFKLPRVIYVKMQMHYAIRGGEERLQLPFLVLLLHYHLSALLQSRNSTPLSETPSQMLPAP